MTIRSPSPQWLWRNHPRSPANNSAERSLESCPSKSKPRARGTRVAVRSVCWHVPLGISQSGTIAANPRLRRSAAVVSSRCVDLRSSNPSPYWPPHGTLELRPRIRSCHRRSRTPRRGSVATRERLGNYESHVLRGARPLAPGCSSGSFPNRCCPSTRIRCSKYLLSNA